MEQVAKFEVGKVYEAVGGAYFISILERLAAHRLAVQLLDRDGNEVSDGAFIALSDDSVGDESFAKTVHVGGSAISVRVYATDEADINLIRANAQKREEAQNAKISQWVDALTSQLKEMGVSVNKACAVYSLLREVPDEVLSKLFEEV